MASHYNFGIFKLFYLNLELKLQWSNTWMYNVQDSSVLYNNALRFVICEDWHFTHMWTSLARLHHFTKRGGLGQINMLNPANFYWSARQEREWSCICVLRGTYFTFLFTNFISFYYLFIWNSFHCKIRGHIKSERLRLFIISFLTKCSQK